MSDVFLSDLLKYTTGALFGLIIAALIVAS